MKGKKPAGTHWAPDLDAVASFWLAEKYGRKELEMITFLRRGDVPEETALKMGVELFDRGRGRFDHHGTGIPLTSTVLVAIEIGIVKEKEGWEEKKNVVEKYKVVEKGEIKKKTAVVSETLEPQDARALARILRKVQRSDLLGESKPFDISDLIKTMQRTGMPNEEIVEVGKRLLDDVFLFSKKGLSRENQRLKKIFEEFLWQRRIFPKFEGYMRCLENPRFECPCDICEVFVGEIASKGEKEAEKFIQRLLEIEYKDSENYIKALEEVKRAKRVVVKGNTIVVGETKNPRFNAAARKLYKALITIQRDPVTGHTQFYFDIERTPDELIDALASLVRLEECLVQGRKIPETNLSRPGYIEEIPEWYYYRPPRIPTKKQKPGRFIQNGSLTAPDVPPTRIPIKRLIELAEMAVLYYKK